MIMVCLSCVAKTLLLDIAYKLFEQNSFKPAKLRGTIDFCLFILLSVAMTLAEGYKVSRKQKLMV